MAQGSVSQKAPTYDSMHRQFTTSELHARAAFEDLFAEALGLRTQLTESQQIVKQLQEQIKNLKESKK